MRGRRAFAISTLVGAAVLASGCTTTVSGTAHSAARPTTPPVADHTIQQVLVGDNALSGILDQSFRLVRRPPPQLGGAELLRDDTAQWAPDCLGVTRMLERSSYQSGDVTSVAVETWKPNTTTATVLDVEEGVVGLASPGDAESLFAKFAAQWHRCDGATHGVWVGKTQLHAKITNVDIDPSVLAATVWMTFPTLGLQTDAVRTARALGVRGNYLVEVKVEYSHRADASRPKAGELNTGAVAIAQAMLDNISGLL